MFAQGLVTTVLVGALTISVPLAALQYEGTWLLMADEETSAQTQLWVRRAPDASGAAAQNEGVTADVPSEEGVATGIDEGDTTISSSSARKHALAQTGDESLSELVSLLAMIAGALLPAALWLRYGQSGDGRE